MLPALLGLIFGAVCIKAQPESTAQVEVRAVLISCDPPDEKVPFDNEAARFEREESFKHSLLTDCKKKIALTVKFTSEPDVEPGDEYIPIEHVFQGSTKRVRLLNPYVLRLRKEPPVQAYKIKKISTVKGTLSQDVASRVKRDSESSDSTTQNQQNNPQKVVDRAKKSVTDRESDSNDQLLVFNNDPESSHITVAIDGKELRESLRLKENKGANEAFGASCKPKSEKPEPYEINTKLDIPEVEDSNSNIPLKFIRQNGEVFECPEKDYVMYEIGNADLWNTIQVQLFEKLTTPEGRIAWNDLTKGTPARVSSLSPEWTGKDISIVYKSSEWIPRDGFSLTSNSVLLLAPGSRKDTAADNTKPEPAGQYIVVPQEDILGVPLVENATIHDDSFSEYKAKAPSSGPEEAARRVIIRMSRALINNHGVKAKIVPRDGENYLTLAHSKPYHAQIDLETRADTNQLIYVGSSGRIMTVVADSSRRTRSVLTAQVTNMGLAAARFKVVARDCNPELPEILSTKINEEDSSFILIPPRHTRTVHIDVPAEIPADVAHCSVALINNYRETVAVRDVAIRKGDRCFCVWHCECVCLGEDPKLLCREMPETRQSAAGLSPRERTRLVRSVCYHDVLSLNFCITALGVIVILMIFGFLKACLGLVSRWAAMWGLAHVLHMPRKLDHYYESNLNGRTVVYDDEGWPVHPDTKERTVRLISLPMEFVLNLIFFVMAPSVFLYELIMKICSRYKISDAESNWSLSKNYKKCYNSRGNVVQSSGDAHLRRRRSARLQRWMTPEAEHLTSNVLEKGMPTRASMIREYMHPLLCENVCHAEGTSKSGNRESCGDSEIDDTEYVLMQMQKSRVSLAKSQRKLNGSARTVKNKE